MENNMENMNNEYKNIEEMLEKDKQDYLESVRDEVKDIAKGQIDILMKGIIEMAKNNPAFERQLMLPWKSFKKCYSYMENLALGMAARNKDNTAASCIVTSDVLFDWINEYYFKDDKAEWEAALEAEKKKAEERKKQQEARKQAYEDSKEEYKQKYGDSPDSVVTKIPDTPSVQTITPKKTKDCEGQLDFFGMMA